MTLQHALAHLLTAALAGLAFMAPAHAVPVTGQGTWQTTLQARDLDGNGQTDAFYDTRLNITWLRDANANRNTDLYGYAAQYNDPYFLGRLNWNDANTWAQNLSFGGYSDWRLPTMVDTGAPGCVYSETNPGIWAGGTDCAYNVQTSSGSTVYSEMASLYYDTLGNKGYCPPGSANCNNYNGQAGWGLTNTGNFIDLQPDGYWSGLEYAPVPSDAWYFYFYDGVQYGYYKGGGLFAMAVRPGDVTAASVPEPGTLVLAAAALVGLGVGRRRQAMGAWRL